MSKLDINFYRNEFGGNDIPPEDFQRLARVSSDVIYDVCNKKPTDEEMDLDLYLKAICYEVEMLHEQGGIDAIVGYGANSIGSESLGGYSVSGGSDKATVPQKDGVPVSSLAVSLLRRLGLMSRWMYSGVERA